MADEPITINVSDYEVRRFREGLAGLYGSLDAKRPTAWSQYGYSETVSFSMLFRAYDRGGPGHGAVHRLLDKCWQERPRIKQIEADEETDWEKTVGELISSVNGWVKLRDFDRRNMVGNFAALIYRVADGQALREPMARGQSLKDLVPVYQDQIRVTDWHSDLTDPDSYGKPKMFQFQSRRLVNTGVDTQGQPIEWQDVHPSRVQILAEGSVGDMFDGVPLLKAGFNHLTDIEKIGGGSAESFLKNSARTIVFEYGENAQVGQEPEGGTKTVREYHEEQSRALNRNQDASIVMQNGKATTLQTTVSDPTGAFQLAANLFAASVQIPFTVLFGQQTGRLASDEDKADMVARCKSRQINELTPMLEEFVKRMQAAGLIDEGEFEIEWPPLDAPGDKERLDLVDKMAGINLKAFQAGDQPVFNTNEQRKAAGYEEIPDGDEMLTPDEKAAAETARQVEVAKEAAKAQPKQQPGPQQQKLPAKA